MTMRTKQNVLELYPLTPLQQGILYHSLASFGGDPYHVRVCFRIEGPVDAEALRRAWQTVVDRHEALRADLEWVKSKQPIQIVFRQCPVELVQLDWQDAPPAQLAGRLRTLVDEEAARFALARTADQRITLVRLAGEADREHYLLWTFHHALLDGWSVANVLGEVLASYRADVAGEPIESAGLSAVTGHARYLAWLRAQDGAAAEDYWKTTLTGYEAVEFPPPAPERAPAAERGGFAERSMILDEALARGLRELASSSHTTLSTCFQGALALLVRALTGKDDVVFGATVAGRPADLPGASAMVGAFINTVPVRTRAVGGEALGAWLGALHREAGQRRAFEHLGLPRIQELAALPAGRALFEAILVFENFPVSEVLEQAEALPFSVEPHRVFDEEGGITLGRGRNNYPLTFVVLPGKKIELIVAYHRERVGDALAAELLERFAGLLRAMAEASAEQRIGALGALGGRGALGGLGVRGSSASDHAAAAAPIAPAAPAAPFRAIHERIAHWATATPGAVAVRCDDRVLTYAELDAAAGALAARLLSRGVGAGDRVGLLLPRAPEFLVALLAAMKCGAAYVPFEPDTPRARLAGLCADAQLAALLTRTDQLVALGGLHPITIAVDDLAHEAAVTASGAGFAPAAVPAEAPVYHIYTSGSTGTPKGVVISHRALASYVDGVVARLDELGPGATASMAMISTVAADLGHTSLYGALCSGGTLHLIREERAGDPDAFADYMQRHQVAALKIVPGHLWGLMQTATPDRALPAHTLILGGEAAPPPLLAHLRQQRACRVLNHYGPTETAVGILTHPVVTRDGPVEAASAAGAPPPLGRPLPAATAYVLGPELRPLPAGVPGELFLGGDSLAAGYFRRPELTAERFLPDPFSRAPGARLYRTGDRGRLREDGAIEFLGRADDQVKLRGFRVELGEIRAALVALPGVSDARVIVRPGAAGTPQLVAYLVGARGEHEPAALLRERLPEHMVPSAFVWLEKFPVTANGKVDLARLPDPSSSEATGATGASAGAGTRLGDGVGAAPASAVRPPDTEAERALAAIWMEVLNAKQVSLDDNFFQLGGDSILALKIVARAKRAGWKITPKQLLAHPTLVEAARIAQPIAATPAAKPVTSTSGSVSGSGSASVSGSGSGSGSGSASDILLTPIQLHFLETQKLDPHHYNQALLLALSTALPLPALQAALIKLTQRHAALRLRFAKDGGKDAHGQPTWRAWLVSPDADFSEAAVRVDLTAELATGAAPSAVIDRVCGELQRGFDLARGPLLRAAYLDLGASQEPRLLLFAHHLIVDGVSWRILLEELADELAAKLTGAPSGDRTSPATESTAEAPTTSFAEWTQRLHAFAKTPALRDEATYWRRVLTPHPDDTAAPVGALTPRRAANVVGDSAIATLELDEATTAAMLARAPKAYATLVNELMLAALSRALCHSWQRRSLLVTVEGHGREDLFDGVDLSRTVGWFSTTYPVRFTPTLDSGADAGSDAGAAIGETVRTIQRELRAVPQGGLGYGVLRHLVPSSSPEALPADAEEPRVTFNYLGQFDQAFAGQALFRMAPENSGRRRSPHTPRPSWFVVNAVVYEGVLRIDWEYSRALHDRGEVEALLSAYAAELRAVVAHCEARLAGLGGESPSAPGAAS